MFNIFKKTFKLKSFNKIFYRSLTYFHKYLPANFDYQKLEIIQLCNPNKIVIYAPWGLIHKGKYLIKPNDPNSELAVIKEDEKFTVNPNLEEKLYQEIEHSIKKWFASRPYSWVQNCFDLNNYQNSWKKDSFNFGHFSKLKLNYQDVDKNDIDYQHLRNLVETTFIIRYFVDKMLNNRFVDQSFLYYLYYYFSEKAIYRTATQCTTNNSVAIDFYSLRIITRLGERRIPVQQNDHRNVYDLITKIQNYFGYKVIKNYLWSPLIKNANGEALEPLEIERTFDHQLAKQRDKLRPFLDHIFLDAIQNLKRNKDKINL